MTTSLVFSGKTNLCLQEDDLIGLHGILELLKQFYYATTEISSEKHTSSSKVIPMVKVLKNKMSKSTTPLSIKLTENVEKRFGDIETLDKLCIATLLDPRFKKN